MAYFQRLIFCVAVLVLSWLPASSYAGFPVPSTCSTPPPVGTGARNIYDNQGSVSAGCYGQYNTVIRVDSIGVSGSGCMLIWSCANGTHPNQQAPFSRTLVCPAGSTLSGGVCTCQAPSVENAAHNGCEIPPPPVCTPPQVLNAAGNACVDPPACQAGQSKPSTFDSGWSTPGDMAGAFQAFNDFKGSPGCQGGYGSGGGQACAVSWGSDPAGGPPRENFGSSGHSYYTFYTSGTTTGASCPSPTNGPGSGPEPVCRGQSGVFNGTSICLPEESQFSKDKRASDAADKAAQDARRKAINDGLSTSAADAAARAAGKAAGDAIRSGATSAEASKAGSAAGSAAGSSAASGASSSTTMAEGSAAGAAEAARERARTIAASSGASSTVVDQAVSSAGAAAATAAANVLNNGGTYAQAAEAARIAGQVATASVLTGSTGAIAADNAANAAAGNEAASGSGMGSSPGSTGAEKSEDIGDFCAKNPQAKMCKTEEDSTFAGACGSPPACSGDAVMCAIAAATFKQECNWNPPPSADSAAYDAAKGKTGDQTGNLPGNSTVTISGASFDQTEILGAATGMSDRSVTVMGSAITLPFSSINLWLQRLGYILKAVTFLLCLRIVTRG